MDFENSLKKAIYFNSKVTLLLSESTEIDQEQYDSFEDFIKPINKLFVNENFWNKFNEDIFSIERNENNMFLSGLIENLITYLNFLADNFEVIPVHDEDKISKIQETITTLESISKFDMAKQIVLINNGFIIEILKFLENDTISFSLRINQILNIALNLSKHKFYEKIDFPPEYPLRDSLEILSNLKQSNRLDADGAKFADDIVKNLKSNSIEDCLKKFQTNINVNLNGESLVELVRDETFIDDLRLLSITLNNDNNTFFYWDLFKKYNSIYLFTKLLDFMFKILKDELSCDSSEDDNREIVHRVLRDLLEIIFQLVQKSYKFKKSFLDKGMFIIFIKFFEDISLVEFLVKAYVNTISKIVSIFFLLCRKLYYLDDVSPYISDRAQTVKVLIDARTKIESLSIIEESMGLQEKPIFRMFLICLAYLEKKLDLLLLETRHFEIIATRGFIPKTFKSVSNEFQSHIEKIKWEFMNENNKIEMQEVSRLMISGTTSTAINTIVDALTCLKIIYTSDEAKKIAYDSYSAFMKSILVYGLDIEKIICIACLRKYCSTLEWIRKDIFEDKHLVGHLNSLYHSNRNLARDDAIKRRLNETIFEFFKSNGYKHELDRRTANLNEIEVGISKISIKN
jgi:hypothetical protein